MRRSVGIAGCGAAILSCGIAHALPAQGSFEGTVTYQMIFSNKAPMSLVYMFKGSKMRVDMGPQAVVVYDGTSGNFVTMMPQQKMYMEMNAKDVMAAAKGDSTRSPADFKIAKTGTSETVAGTACDDYVVSDTKHPERETDMCVAHGMGSWMSGNGISGLFGGRGGSALPSGYDALMKKFGGDFFPLKVDSKKDGQDEMQMAATQIERKSLDAALFATPPDYKKLDMGGMGAMLQQPPH
jgi:hypothetical protein